MSHVAPPRGFAWNSRRLSSGILLGLLIVGLVPAAAVRAAEDPIASFKAAERQSRELAPRLVAATVGIINQSLASHSALGEGSGVVVSEDGLILTVGHVMGDSGSELTVVFPDGRRAKAKCLGAEFSRDAGMAKITEPGKWPHVEMGRSAEVKPGQWCLAIGHPGGIHVDRTPPVRLGRILGLPQGNAPMQCLVSDATVISGDSGGPLFDLQGRVIGIHSNIGMRVTENRHVPVDVYRDKWNDLVAGKQTGQRLGQTQVAGGPMPDMQKFHRLFAERMAAGDPEVRGMVQQGHVMLTPEKVKALLEKWEKQGPTAQNPAAPPAPPSADAASKPIDFLRFQRLFQERLLVGDPEVLGMIRDGKMMIVPDQMHRLMDNWEKKMAGGPPAQAPAKPAAAPASSSNPMADMMRFQQLLHQRVQAGDPEALEMVKKGQIQLTPPQMKALLEKWEKLQAAAPGAPPVVPLPGALPPGMLPPGAPVDPAKMAELMKHAKPDGKGGMKLEVTPENAPKVMGLLEALGQKFGHAMMGDLAAGKGGKKVLAELKPAVQSAAKSTAVVLRDGKPVALGAVVRKDGLIVTKASELGDKPVCKIGGRDLPAVIVKKNDAHDLALLKVQANDLAPIAWADGDGPSLGTWLVTPGADGRALGLGIVGVPARPIPESPKILLKNRAAVGIQLNHQSPQAQVMGVAPGTPAEKAGLKAGDLIQSINGKPMANSKEVHDFMGQFKPGDKAAFEIKRGDQTLQLSAELVSSDMMAPTPGKGGMGNVQALSRAGGSLSNRSTNFPLAVTHDTVLGAADCGGPVVGLDGRAVGLNIARQDRTATYAIPAAALRPVVEELLREVK